MSINNLAWMAAERKVKLDEALEWATKAGALGPKVPEFQGTLGWVHRARGDLAKAAQALQKAATLKPERPAIIYHLAVVHQEQGKTKEALAELKKALALDKNFPGADDARRRLQQLSRGRPTG